MSLSSQALSRALGLSLMLGLFGFVALSATNCASSRCQFQSDCTIGRCINGSCEKQCQADIDCPSTAPSCKSGVCYTVDGGLPPTSDAASDAGSTTTPTGDDATSPVTDSTTTPPPDTTTTTTPPPDSTTTTSPPPDATGGSKALLDHCGADGECSSGHCTANAPHFCTKACSVFSDCPDGMVCAAGLCQLDDTGKFCSTASPGTCATGECIGTSFVAHCTHDCASGSDCPAGFACSPTSGRKVCINIELPCGSNACPSSLCLGSTATSPCTAVCTSDADCPVRATGVGLHKFTCQTVSGKNVCVPPAEVVGADPLGTSCPATGTVKCASGLCDTGASSPICNEACVPRGGCPSGWGCFPDVVDSTAGTITYLCNHAGGSGWVGDTCTRAADCVTGLCQGRTTGGAFCTRLCVDGLCPTGLSCTAAGTTAEGLTVKICN